MVIALPDPSVGLRKLKKRKYDWKGSGVGGREGQYQLFQDATAVKRRGTNLNHQPTFSQRVRASKLL